jgi:hypothetical protein
MVHFLGSELGRVKMQATPLLRMIEALEKSLEDLQPIQSFFKFIFFWKENFSRREKRDANKNIVRYIRVDALAISSCENIQGMLVMQ